MKIEIGDIFYFDVAYEDDPSTYKRRPVILLDEDENNILLLVSTTSKARNNPLKWYDYYKIPVNNWRKTGLREASWVRGKRFIRLARVEVESIVKQRDYIGKLHPEDYSYIIDKLNRLHR